MNAPNVYDAVVYPSMAHAQTHPDRLSTIAALFGLSSAPSERCRVLEVGCGDGMNLIAMATALPGSTFVGFDLAAQPVAAGRQLVERLGLKNVTLTQLDLMAATRDLGTFDYIIAHGFYAWVPAPVQDRLLSLCGELLDPQGVAYVSYNAYPGCRLRELLRDLMQYHTRGMEEPAARLAAAKAAVDFVRRNMADAAEFGGWILTEMERLVEQNPAVLYHDTLGEIYRPCYFHEFVRRASTAGLRFLGEADFHEMNEEPFSAEAAEKLRSFGPERIVEREQLLDFLKMKPFRQTLLCRDSVALRRSPSSEDLSRFHITTRAHPVSPPSPKTPPGSIEYRTPKGARMVTDSPVFNRLMARLGQAWPGSVPFAELAEIGAGKEVVSQLLIRMYGMAIIDLYPSPPRFAVKAGPRPRVSELARLQIERSTLVTNRLQVDVRMDDATAKEFVRRLDGTRDRAALIRDMAAAGIQMNAESLEAGLRQLANLALLTA